MKNLPVPPCVTNLPRYLLTASENDLTFKMDMVKLHQKMIDNCKAVISSRKKWLADLQKLPPFPEKDAIYYEMQEGYLIGLKKSMHEMQEGYINDVKESISLAEDDLKKQIKMLKNAQREVDELSTSITLKRKEVEDYEKNRLQLAERYASMAEEMKNKTDDGEKKG